MADWPEDVVLALSGWQQGDILAGVSFPYWGAPDAGIPFSDEEVAGAVDGLREFDVLIFEPTPATDLGVITTQTCDIDERGAREQPWVQVSPLVQLQDLDPEKTLPEFLYRVSPPDLEPADWAVDVRMEVPVEKTAFVGQIRRPAFAREAEAIAFGEFLGRRRDRAALADSLVKTVTGSLRQQRRKGGRFKKALRQEVRRVGLRIDEGTRTLPVAVGVHVICHEEPSSRVKEVFEEWWDTARAEAGAEKITLLPNSFHDARAMPLDIYDNLVKLELG